ncbi:MAG TPA: hypothetical protein VN181_04165, partial [Thermoanaerobaculia bacterium]|nr:hypothetical protein [Thermoanaerobaculia bacterium]
MSPPTVTKSIAPASIPAGGTSTLTITLTNTNASPITGVSFTDNYDADIDNAAAPGVNNTCGGAVTAVGGDSSLALSGGTIPASSTCTISVFVTSTVPGTHTNTIPAGGIITANAGSNPESASDDLLVIGAPTASKDFTPPTILAGGTSTLTITLSNSNGAPITGVAFTDTYPAGVFNAATPNASTTCGGTVTTPTSGSVSLSGGTIPANGSCIVAVTLTSSVAGSHQNTLAAGAVTSSNAPANAGAAVASLLVIGPPAVSKSFTPSSVAVLEPSTLTITLTNPNAGTAITGVAFIDDYPSGVVNANPANASTTCGGALIASNGGTSVALSGGTIAAGGSCTVTVTVLASAPGNYPNTIDPGDVTSANAGSNTAPATATLSVDVLPPPSVTKTFTPSVIAPGESTIITITLTNGNAQAITGVAFTDNYPSGMVNATTPNATSTCGGIVSAVPGDDALSLSGGTIPANGSCTVTVRVVTLNPGSYQNVLPAGSVTSANAAPNAAAVTGTLSAAVAEAIPALDGRALLALALLLGVVAVFALRSH